MASLPRVVRLTPLTLVLLGCAASATAKDCPTPAVPVAVAGAPGTAPGAAPALPSPAPAVDAAPTVEAGASPSASAAAQTNPASAAPAASAPASTGHPLPELKLTIAGMHIGGGPNDEPTKRPFLRTIEAAFPKLRDCYRKVDQPGQSGTFGVDLKVDRAGGHPQLRDVRTILKGDAFRSCVEGTIKELEFGAPPKGPTVLSVSVRFAIAE